jgi:hypothetical protein
LQDIFRDRGVFPSPTPRRGSGSPAGPSCCCSNQFYIIPCHRGADAPHRDLLCAPDAPSIHRLRDPLVKVIGAAGRGEGKKTATFVSFTREPLFGQTQGSRVQHIRILPLPLLSPKHRQLPLCLTRHFKLLRQNILLLKLQGLHSMNAVKHGNNFRHGRPIFRIIVSAQQRHFNAFHNLSPFVPFII